MTTRNRYAVPLEELDRVHVGVAEQVQEEAAAAPPDGAELWGGSLVPAHGDGGGDADGD